ncbi:MAG: DUF87 domain-containing protein [Chloroflexi bacterium]|nr:DUF87 domain-containing protein [Chloroflexota bacterium]
MTDAVYLAFDARDGWSFVGAEAFRDAPDTLVRVRSKSLAGGPDVHVLCRKADAGLDVYGQAQIGRRARRFLLDGGYARLDRGRGLVVDWNRITPAAKPDRLDAERDTSHKETDMQRELTIESAIDLAPGLQLPMESIIGQTLAVLGTTGSGKSMTVRRIVEQMLGAGLPMCVFDIEGEYHTLREAHHVLIFGKTPGQTVDLPITAETADRIADASLRQQQPVIVDLSGWRSASERIAIVAAFLNRLLDVAEELRRPYHVVLEEAQLYVPQSAPTDATDIITEIATRGRKRGLGIILASQRAARVDKDVLTQAVVKVFHFVRYDTDAQTYIANIPSAWMTPAEVKAAAFEMGRGEALVVNDRGVTRVKVTAAETTHAGYTPGVDRLRSREQTAQQVDAATLEAFAALLGAPSGEIPQSDTAPDNELTALKARIAALESEIRAKDVEIAKLRAWLNGHTFDPAAHAAVSNGHVLHGTSIVLYDADISPAKAADAQAKADAEKAPDYVEKYVNADYPNGASMAERMANLTAALRERGELPLVDELDQRIEERQEAARQSAIRRQREKFDQLVRKLRAWTGTGVGSRRSWKRDFVALLARHERLSTAQAVQYLGVSRTTFVNNPPLTLVRLGIAQRTGPRTNPVYSWNAPVLFKFQFPDLDPDELTRRLI